jgi:hypothetical protein
MSRRARTMMLAAAVLVAAVIVLVVLVKGDHVQRVPHPNVTTTLGGPGHDTIILNAPAQQIVKQQKAEDAAGNSKAAESNLNAPAPPPQLVEQSKALKPAGQPAVPAKVPLASVSTTGCTTKLVRNFSSRRGAPVLLGVIHWTGSRPTPGSPASGLAIVSWFDQPAAQASSNYITDQDGRCWLVVAESQKAWTQANYNAWAISDEIVNQGVQPLLQNTRARATVIRLMRGWHARWHIPYRYARVTQAGCRVVRSGFLAHRDLGACGGGHPDVGSFDVAGLIREAARGSSCNRACDLRHRYKTTTTSLRRIGCKPLTPASGGRCLTLHRRAQALRHAATKAHVTL